jgi:hypothetical protein
MEALDVLDENPGSVAGTLADLLKNNLLDYTTRELCSLAGHEPSTPHVCCWFHK